MATVDREQLGELLSAYLDGELDEQQTQLVERALREESSARRLLDELRATADLVASLPRHAAPKSIAQEVGCQLERGELLGDYGGVSDRVGRRGSSVWSWLSMAAMLVLVVGGGLWILHYQGPDRAGPGEDVVALAQADHEKESIDFKRREKGDADRRVVNAGRAARGRQSVPSLSNEAGRSGGPAKKAKRPTPTMIESDTAHGGTGERRFERSINEGTPRAPAVAVGIDQRPILSADVAAIRARRFADETIRLRVTLTDEAGRAGVMSRVVAGLAKRRAVDLGGRLGSGDLTGQGIGSFYYQGGPGINFDDADSAQVLVRLPARELEQFVDEITYGVTDKDSVSLAVGPFRFRGLHETRQALWRIEGPAPMHPGPEEHLQIAASRPDDDAVAVGESIAEPGGGAWDGLIEAMGLESEVFSAVAMDGAKVGEPEAHVYEGTTSAYALDNVNAGLAPVPGITVADATAGEDASKPGGAFRSRGGKGPGITAEPGLADDEGQVDSAAPSYLQRDTSRAEVFAPEEPSSLVYRRSRALEARRRGPGEASPTWPGGGQDVPGPGGDMGGPRTPVADGEIAEESDQLVTLVIELGAAPEGTSKPPHYLSRPARKRDTETRPSKSTPPVHK